MVEDTSTEDVIVEPADQATKVSAQDDFVRQLASLYKQLKFAKNLKKAMKEVEGTILELMGVKMFTIYQSVETGGRSLPVSKAIFVPMKVTMILKFEFLSRPPRLPGM